MLAMIVAALGLAFLITRFVSGSGAERLMPYCGLHVATRVLGILLAALAVQFVLNGISEFVRLLESTHG
jgi:multiple antibiotic resistance protein